MDNEMESALRLDIGMEGSMLLDLQGLRLRVHGVLGFQAFRPLNFQCVLRSSA